MLLYIFFTFLDQWGNTIYNFLYVHIYIYIYISSAIYYPYTLSCINADKMHFLPSMCVVWCDVCSAEWCDKWSMCPLSRARAPARPSLKKLNSWRMIGVCVWPCGSTCPAIFPVFPAGYSCGKCPTAGAWPDDRECVCVSVETCGSSSSVYKYIHETIHPSVVHIAIYDSLADGRVQTYI